MAVRFYILATALAILGIAGSVQSGPILGVFETTPVLNGLHLAAAVVTTLAAVRGVGTMRAWGQLLGYLFAALAVAGFALDSASVASLFPLTTSNAWLHLLIALIFLYHALLAPPTL